MHFSNRLFIFMDWMVSRSSYCVWRDTVCLFLAQLKINIPQSFSEVGLLFFVMGKTKVKKSEEIEALADAFSDAKGVVFANFSGLTVKDATAFRRICKAAGVRYYVAKKTLLKLALEQAGGEGYDPRNLPGGIAALFGPDEVAAAKLVKDFAIEHPAVTFAGGMMFAAANWVAMSKAEVTALASVPSRQELLSQLVGVMIAPVRDTVGVLHGTLRGFVNVMDAVAKSKA